MLKMEYSCLLLALLGLLLTTLGRLSKVEIGLWGEKSKKSKSKENLPGKVGIIAKVFLCRTCQLFHYAQVRNLSQL